MVSTAIIKCHQCLSCVEPQRTHSGGLTGRIRIRANGCFGRVVAYPPADGEAPGLLCTDPGFYFLAALGEIQMHEYNEYVARVAECEQRAKDVRNEGEKQSWLAMADSWRETAKLHEILKRQAEFIRQTAVPPALRV
jgi:hypothetical protein